MSGGIEEGQAVFFRENAGKRFLIPSGRRKDPFETTFRLCGAEALVNFLGDFSVEFRSSEA